MHRLPGIVDKIKQWSLQELHNCQRSWNGNEGNLGENHLPFWHSFQSYFLCCKACKVFKELRVCAGRHCCFKVCHVYGKEYMKKSNIQSFIHSCIMFHYSKYTFKHLIDFLYAGTAICYWWVNTSSWISSTSLFSSSSCLFDVFLHQLAIDWFLYYYYG